MKRLLVALAACSSSPHPAPAPEPKPVVHVPSDPTPAPTPTTPAKPHEGPALAAVHVVKDTYHGVTIEDPYRWLEEDSPETQAWLAQQAGDGATQNRKDDA